MGHSSIKVTFNTYGHLFADPQADQRAAEGVEKRLFGA
jgi:integrase